MFGNADRMSDTISQSGVHFMLHLRMTYKTEAISARVCTVLSFGIFPIHSSFVGVGKNSKLCERLELVYVLFSTKQDTMNFSLILQPAVSNLSS